MQNQLQRYKFVALRKIGTKTHPFLLHTSTHEMISISRMQNYSLKQMELKESIDIWVFFTLGG